MKSTFVEVSDAANWGKFCVSQFEEADLARSSAVSDTPLLEAVAARRRESTGDPRTKRIVVDLQTEEGLILDVDPGRDLVADLDRHQIWCCPLLTPFLQWLRSVGPVPVDQLPAVVTLPPGGEPKLQGWRRPGPEFAPVLAIREKLLGALRAAAQLPASQVQIAVFFEAALTDPEYLLYRLYRDSLTPQDSSRFLGALLTDSGRYALAGTTGTQIGLVPR